MNLLIPALALVGVFIYSRYDSAKTEKMYLEQAEKHRTELETIRIKLDTLAKGE